MRSTADVFVAIPVTSQPFSSTVLPGLIQPHQIILENELTTITLIERRKERVCSHRATQLSSDLGVVLRISIIFYR